MRKVKQPRYVQAQHPITEYWIKIDTFVGQIIGSRKKKYSYIPVCWEKTNRKGELNGSYTPREKERL